MSRQTHWEQVYATRQREQLGWYAPRLTTSLDWIAQLGLDWNAPLIDVGAGASTLADDLLGAGYRSLTLLDIAGPALQAVAQRLGDQAQHVTWLHADITMADLPQRHYALWHDRAVFHFLTTAEERRRYFDNLCHALQPRGHVIVGVFSPAAPPRCSGLPVQRYSAQTLAAEFGPQFELQRHVEQLHVTPGGVEQMYLYCYFRGV